MLKKAFLGNYPEAQILEDGTIYANSNKFSYVLYKTSANRSVKLNLPTGEIVVYDGSYEQSEIMSYFTLRKGSNLKGAFLKGNSVESTKECLKTFLSKAIHDGVKIDITKQTNQKDKNKNTETRNQQFKNLLKNNPMLAQQVQNALANKK